MEQIIDSFINGQQSQFLRQVRENYKFMFDFVQDVQDTDLLNDRQKITILGRVLKSFD